MIKQLSIKEYKRAPQRRTLAQLIEYMDVLAAEVVTAKADLSIEKGQYMIERRAAAAREMRANSAYMAQRFVDLMEIHISRFESTGLAPDEE